MKKLFLLLLSLNASAKWDDWSDKDKYLFKALVLGTTVDYMQTKEMLKKPGYGEGNPFLGSHPSSDRLLAQKTVSIGLVYWAVDNAANNQYRTRGLILANGIQWGVVIHNEKIGATFRYSW